MNGYKVAFFATAALLVGSLGLNVVTARGWADPVASPAIVDAGAPPEPPCQSESRSLSLCQRRLEGCNQKSWEIVQRAIRQGTTRKDSADKEKKKPGTHESTTPKDWRQLLCNLSQDLVRFVWKHHQQNVHAMIEGAGTEEWVDDWLAVRMADIEGRWKLQRHERNQLQDEYRRLWGSHADSMQSVMKQQPADYAAIADAMRDFYKDEDRMVGELFGDNAREEFIDDEFAIRTMMLAMFATFADRPWDDRSIGF